MQTSQKNEENISTNNVRLKGQKISRGKSRENYTVLDEYADSKEFDEKYALLSHCIQLGGTDAAAKYGKILVQNGIELSSLPNADISRLSRKFWTAAGLYTTGG